MSDSHQEDEEEKVIKLRQYDKENYKYYRTTCGLIGFIVFFLGTFLAFIVAGELGEWYEYTLCLGFAMLTVTSVIFVYVLKESKQINSIDNESSQCLQNRRGLQELNELQKEQELLLEAQPAQELPLQAQPAQGSSLQPQPAQGLSLESQLDQGLSLESQLDQGLSLESQPDQGLSLEAQPDQGLSLEAQPDQGLSGEPKKESRWYDRTRIDAYIKQIFLRPFRDSDETTSSENHSDPDMLELRKLAKSGLSASREEPSKESQDNDAARCEDEANVQLHSTKAGHSNAATKDLEFIKSRSDDSPSKALSGLSLSDSSKSTTGSDEKQEGSAALSQLTLDSSKNQVAEMASQNPSSTDFEDKPDVDDSSHAETSIKADGELSKIELKKT